MTWLFAAFAVVWIAVFAYLVRIGNMQKILEDELAALKGKK
ncbi:MAG: CcmD family protein [Candidatus Krumholzibacteria bacterium]|nr:CcmD family protein [Candidatus Krumholzibacteria bacterium]